MITQEMEFSDIPPWEYDLKKYQYMQKHQYMHRMDYSRMLDMLSRFIPERLERIERHILYESYYKKKTLREIAKDLSSLPWARKLRKGRTVDIYFIVRTRKKALKKLLDAFHDNGIQGYYQ